MDGTLILPINRVATMPRRFFTALFSAIVFLIASGRIAGQAGGLPPAAANTIVFFGDSLTAGYGLSDPDREAYPALIQNKIDAAGLSWRVVNAGLSGETTAGGLRRVNWILRQPVGIFVLALGANDGLRGLPPPLIESNLRAIIARVRAARPNARILLAGMRLPTNFGDDYIRQFAAVFPAVAREENLGLIPFLLEGVGGHPDLNQADAIHPAAAGDALIANTVWLALRPLLTAGN
jgi:acyl-CoA thioesterase I